MESAPIYKWVVEEWQDDAERYVPICKHTRFPRCEQRRILERGYGQMHTRKIYPGEDLSNVPTLKERLDQF